MFEMNLDKCLYYVIYYKGIVIKFQYLKSTFKNRKSTIGIQKVIALGIKGLMHFLEKKVCINSNIYINQVLEKYSYFISNTFKKEIPSFRQTMIPVIICLKQLLYIAIMLD